MAIEDDFTIDEKGNVTYIGNGKVYSSSEFRNFLIKNMTLKDIQIKNKAGHEKYGRVKTSNGFDVDDIIRRE